tara:strand:+ start:426 stop:2318 length:1893 start_codon:yes stop_codon:yes gene_type:complete
MSDAAKIYDEGFNSGLRPDPLVKVSEWADEYRVLSQVASSEPGRWRTSRTPYLKDIMDCLSPASPIERVAFMKGAQIGATEMGGNWVGYVIDQAPGPMLVVQPTVELGKRWSKGRLAPLIDDTPVLTGRVKDPRSRDSGNTVQSKEFPGGIVVVTGSNSAVGLRSMPVRYLFLDEVSAYPGDADGEGDPVSLAIQRTATFSRRKILMVSTPTIQGLCRIEMEFEASDRRYFYLPCPECNEYQKLKWTQITWQGQDPSTTRYVCEHCGYHIENHQKTWMLERGEWRAEGISNGKVAGFHLSSLYSPVGWFSWSDAVERYITAADNDQLLKVWYNTTLGEPWQDKGDAPDWERIYERAEDYQINTIPMRGLFLTAGADIQKDRIEVEVVAWGRNKETWSVAYNVLLGNPAEGKVWDKLTELLLEPFKHESGIDLNIMMLAVDSGYATQEVYNWTRKHSVSRVMAVKGRDQATAALGSPTKVDVTSRGRKLKRGARVWPVGVSILKSELYHWLKLTKDEDGESPSGYCHFPKYDTEYFKQLTAEQLVTKIVKGYPKREWQKVRERNEALDCRVYARAAAAALGIDHWNDTKWDKLAATFEKDTSVTSANHATKPSKSLTKQSRRKVRRSSFIG